MNYLKRQQRVRISQQLNQAYSAEPTPAERRVVRQLKTKLPVVDRW